MSKEYILKLTKSELEVLNYLINDNIEEGWHYGRQDYWKKNINSLQEKINSTLGES